MNSWGNDPWSGLQLDAVTDATGNLTQLFPAWAQTGVNPWASYTVGAQVRRPIDGFLDSVQVETDQTNGGVIEIWDISGHDAGLDESSTVTAITNAVRVALEAQGLAKLLYRQNFTGSSGATIPTTVRRMFARGLAARYILGSAPSTQFCKLNLAVVKGFILTSGMGNP